MVSFVTVRRISVLSNLHPVSNIYNNVAVLGKHGAKLCEGFEIIIDECVWQNLANFIQPKNILDGLYYNETLYTRFLELRFKGLSAIEPAILASTMMMHHHESRSYRLSDIFKDFHPKYSRENNRHMILFIRTGDRYYLDGVINRQESSSKKYLTEKCLLIG
jgi:hypothetical protein